MERKKFAWKKYLFVLVLTTLVFAGGIVVGNQITSEKVEKISELQRELKIKTLDAETQYLLIQDRPCEFVNITPLTEEVYKISNKLSHMEEVAGKNDEEVLKLKRYYSLLEARHWIFLKKLNKDENCPSNKTTVLFFYSNKEEECPSCEKQGYILNWLNNKYSDINIYSFDVNLESNTIESLERYYKVNTTPFIAFSKNVKRGGFTDKGGLQEMYRGYKEKRSRSEDVENN